MYRVFEVESTVLRKITTAPRNRSTQLIWLGLVIIFFLALVPRINHPTARFMLWYSRSYHFWEGLRNGELTDTYQKYHPGVTTMWVAGLGVELYRIANGLESDDIPSSIITDPQAPAARAGLVAMGLAMSGCIVLVALLLSKLTRWLIALTAGFLLALDPFYIANSQMIHVDAFLATFMLVSVLSWLVYQTNKQQRFLIISGLFAGLAFLTKSPSYFLVPFVGLVTFLQIATDHFRLARGSKRERSLSRSIWRAIITLGAWALIAVVTFFILWPAMWVAPEQYISLLFASAVRLAETPHPQSQFFAGNIFSDDPGFLYYVATLLWQTTALSLMGAVLTIYYLIKTRTSGDDQRSWYYLLVYIGGFVAMMMVAQKKWGRYILPAMIAIDVLAAYGIVKLAEWMADKIHFPKISWRAALFVCTALFIQGIVIFSHQPYFGTHFNYLVGGPRVARYILPLGLQGEGMDDAVEYLNALPGSEFLRVATQPGTWDFFHQKFAGFIVRPSDDPSLVVYYVNYMQRNQLEGYLLAVWQRCQQEGPTWSASYGGVPYIWICPSYPQSAAELAIENEREVKVGDHITLLGYDLSPKPAIAGDELALSLYWQSDSHLPVDNHVFVHLTDQNGDVVAQHDGVPQSGLRPTWSWLENEVIQDDHILTIPQSLEVGRYTLMVGMYDFGTLERLPAVVEGGERFMDDRIILEDVTVSSP